MSQQEELPKPPWLPATADATDANKVDRAGQPSSDGDAASLEALGRYRIGELLGAGGMGAVYEAYDPQLERVVAVKVLREDREVTTNRKLRLLREAKVMAKLAHPNVIRVYDVGIANGRVFLAMEHIKGQTLGHWLAQETRAAADILKTFTAAGRGLAAAHEAGLVHRDFKPSNVMVSEDGRVLVTDFGLARSAFDLEQRPSTDDSGSDDEGARTSPPPVTIAAVTDAGVTVGTPGYMAPEQLGTGPVDARADQFSFCVSLWEALSGELPYPSHASFADGAARLRIPSARAGGRMSTTVRRALARGLSIAPGERYPTMAALLAALARDPARTRRRVALGAFAMMGVAALGAVGARTASRAPDPCGAGAGKASAVWNARARAAIEASFGSLGLPYAKPALAAVTTALDAYAERWAGMYRDACMATRVRGEQSDELLDLRMACLSNHLREMSAVEKVFESADRKTVERATTTAQNLPALDDCANAALLRGEAKLPSDPGSRVAVDEVRGALAGVRALEAAGRFKEGLAQAGDLVSRTAALHYRPLEGEVLLMLGLLQDDMSDYPSAVPTLEHAANAATAGRSPRVAAEAEVKLTTIVGFFQGRVKDGERWAENAEASLEAAGDDAELRIGLLLARANVAAKDSRYDQALGYDRDALALAEKRHGDRSLEYARTVGDMGNTLLQQGNFSEALGYQRRALAIKEAVLGPAHPHCAFGWMNIGATLHELQDDDAALDAHRRALAIDEGAYGRENLETVRDLDNIGIVLVGAGKAAQAEPVLREALAIKERLLSPDDLEIGFTLDVLDSALRDLNRWAEARTVAERALEIQLAATGADNIDTADMQRHCAEVLVKLGDRAAARKDVVAAIATYESKLGAKSAPIARGLLVLGEIQRADGDRVGASQSVGRALAAFDADPSSETWTPEVCLELAKALWAEGPSMHARARELAEGAAAKARDSRASQATVASVEQWMATHRD